MISYTDGMQPQGIRALPDLVRPSRRERVRAATIDEIKSTALRLMAVHGSDVRFADIAREMGVTAPALYRYFADREELLTALMVDGFSQLASQLGVALDASPPDDLAARIRAVGRCYRSFAVADPQRFSLLFGPPASGYGSHAEGGALPANVAVMATLEQLVGSVIDHGELHPPLVPKVGRSLAKEISVRQSAEGSRIPAGTYQSLLHALFAIHGSACLEAFGHLDWLSPQSRRELFEAQLTLLAQAMGTPALAT